MSKIQKATIGIAFSTNMYRLSTLSGQLADELLKLRGNSIPNEYFANIGRGDLQNVSLSLFNKEIGVHFGITQTEISYTFDFYNSENIFSFEKFINQFEAIWNTSNSVLKFPLIRRIGFVTEQRIYAGSKSNNILLDNLTTMKPNGFPARFQLTYDDRINTGKSGLPDYTKDDFINIIRSYYDSLLDVNHPEPDHINGNLDVQRYYAPNLSGTPIEEIRKLKSHYDKASIEFVSHLEQLESKHAKTT